MGQASLIICGGIHPPETTQQMMADMSVYATFREVPKYIHAATAPPDIFSARPLREALQQMAAPAIFLAFSAGCLAAASAARYWHYQTDGQVLALFAVDGWGVPLMEPFPVHRLSHDHFTHLTTTLPGVGEHFYADPAVPHQQMWQAPSQVLGIATARSTPTTAAAFIETWIAHYLSHGNP